MNLVQLFSIQKASTSASGSALTKPTSNPTTTHALPVLATVSNVQTPQFASSATPQPMEQLQPTINVLTALF